MIQFLRCIALVLGVGLVVFIAGLQADRSKAEFDSSNLISDGSFINTGALDTNGIQDFLNVKGSFLKDYSEGGRSAAQIICDASRGYGEASGSINGITIDTSTGTVNPQVIIVTLQKEQSLISKTSQDDNALRKAMGYACPDSGGCNSAYAGFTKQVENGAWQLRYNYERASGRGFSDYQVGQSFSFADWNGTHTGTFNNRATASLYRYTPHVYNGNYNFYNLFNQYFVQKPYNAAWAGQSVYPTMRIGDSTVMEVTFRNVGTETWYSTGSHPVILALDKYWADRTAWQGSGWISQNRLATAQEETVAPGATGTFRFAVACPTGMTPGAHKFYVRLVSEGLIWFDNPDTNGGAWWNINVPRPTAQWTGQSVYPTLWPGQTASMSVSFRNTSGVAWSSSGSAPVNLALDRLQDENFLKRFKHSSWPGDYRVAPMTPSTVQSGEVATFNFTIQAPADISPGQYVFHVRLVQDGFAWFEPDINGGAWWSVNIPAPTASYAGQSGYPTLNRGDTATLWVKFTNSSNITWESSGSSPIVLALDRYWADRTAWQGSGWISQNRMSTAQEGNIAPGQTGTYSFQIYVPPSMPSGYHQFYVRLVSEGFRWFDNPDTNGAAWWGITVN